ncbi:MAG: cytochrome C oxidase subunit IV family protein [Deltaproteobacteria bacterium]|nr:cytochrome C oxidase subunit IV family protein [Deltaproteobacteria bacterium]
MILLAATVVLAKIDPLHLAVVTSMSIAALKVLLVLLFFMHLKYEKGYYGLMVFIPLVILAIFISLTFSDTYLR